MPMMLQKTYQLKRTENQIKFNKLRTQYPFFEFQSYSFQLNNSNLEVEFLFNISKKYFFKPKLTFIGKEFLRFDNLDNELLQSFVFHIGMVELISYWKVACPPRVIIRPHGLNIEQIKWWKKLYFHGLGEFFYLNGIETDIDGFMHIEAEGEMSVHVNGKADKQNVIVPVGGGKDSVVTIELMKNSGLNVIPLIVNPREASVRTIEAARFSMGESAIVERTLDPFLFELNDRGFLNGHTPFSALLAFIGVLTAAASGSSYVALSNESSANQSTVPGTKINHQYSKSVEFEGDFRVYVSKYVCSGINYFSFLRPVNELQIARLFSNYPWHFSGFRSCNVGSKNDTWCGKCPKCLFTYLILSPFISQQRLKHIFGKNMLEDGSLSPVLDELTGKAAIKPFECIGTPDEVKMALWKLDNLIGANEKPDLLRKFLQDFKHPQHDEGFEMLLKQFDAGNFLDPQFKLLLEQALTGSTNGFGEFFRRQLKNHQKVLILGFGREGRSTYSLFREIFPDSEIGIADRDIEIGKLKILADDPLATLLLGEGYLKAFDRYNFVFKAPGVKLVNAGMKDEGKIISQTGLFLQYFRDRTIGVTGTKGKSTTASLIHHIFQQSGRKSVLMGNIGLPPFDASGDIDQDTVVVFELSAHQLEYVSVSPHVSILLNVYPEHLDHFDTYERYRMAKTNIFRYQIPEDVFITREDEFDGDVGSSVRFFGSRKGLDAALMDNHLEFAQGSEVFSLDPDEFAIKGRHNILNLMAAILAVKEFGVGAGEALAAAKKFHGLPHRMEYVGNYGGIDFYNDSISTVPQSAIAAVKTIPNVNTLILGGFDRGLDYNELVEFLKTTDIRNFIFLGKAGEEMHNLFMKYNDMDKSLFSCSNLEEVFIIIGKYTKKNTVCLLSPAAASYDQFHNFEHRGDAFKKLVRERFG